MSKSDMMTVTAKVQQVGAYGIAQPDEPIEVERSLGQKLVKKGNFVAGLTPRAEARLKAAQEVVEAKADADAKAAADADAKTKVDADAKAAADADAKTKVDADAKAAVDAADKAKAKG